MACGCAGAALVAAGCGLTNSSAKVTTVTVAKTVTHLVTTTAPAPTPAASNACTGSDLSGTFGVLQGSAGAGNIVYTLRVTNASQSPCTVSGLPQLQLLGSGGGSLPTKVTADKPGDTGSTVALQPGASATAQARFSPDVQGVGEGNPCEPKASTLRVTAPGGGTIDVKIDPPTSVCSHGAMQLTPYSTAD
ncbi:MAG TPA: DUF4232 domain-containing protein [Gaiellaceae bacterium]|nr:DUF4232 domain-containing protein [Gaiellaceae bacterium]